MSVDEVASALEGLLAQLEADDVDAIADQIEALAQTTDLTSAALTAFTDYMEGDRRWGLAQTTDWTTVATILKDYMVTGLAQTTDLSKIDPTKPNFCTGVNCYGDHSKLTPE